MAKGKSSKTFGISWDANRYDSSLSPMARLIYIEICKLCNKRGFCWARNSYIAEKFGLSNRTVSRHLKELEGKYIIITGNGTKRAIYIKESEIVSESKPSLRPRQKYQGYEHELETEMSMEHRQECLQSATEMTENNEQESLQHTMKQYVSSDDDALNNINNNITSNNINESPLPVESSMLASLAYDKSPYLELYQSLSGSNSSDVSSALLESE